MSKSGAVGKVAKSLFSGAKKWIIFGGAAVIFAGAAITSYVFVFNQPATPADQLVFAPNAQIGILPGKTDEQIEELLSKTIDENTIAFSINSNAVFENARAKGNLMLESPSNNINYIEFVIRRNDTGDVLYRSGLLKPNQYILEDSLQTKTPLTKGSHECTADITLYDKETLQAKGMVQAALTITIKT